MVKIPSSSSLLFATLAISSSSSNLAANAAPAGDVQTNSNFGRSLASSNSLADLAGRAVSDNAAHENDARSLEQRDLCGMFQSLEGVVGQLPFVGVPLNGMLDTLSPCPKKPAGQAAGQSVGAQDVETLSNDKMAQLKSAVSKIKGMVKDGSAGSQSVGAQSADEDPADGECQDSSGEDCSLPDPDEDEGSDGDEGDAPEDPDQDGSDDDEPSAESAADTPNVPPNTPALGSEVPSSSSAPASSSAPSATFSQSAFSRKRRALVSASAKISAPPVPKPSIPAPGVPQQAPGVAAGVNPAQPGPAGATPPQPVPGAARPPVAQEAPEEDSQDSESQ